MNPDLLIWLAVLLSQRPIYHSTCWAAAVARVMLGGKLLHIQEWQGSWAPLPAHQSLLFQGGEEPGCPSAFEGLGTPASTWDWAVMEESSQSWVSWSSMPWSECYTLPKRMCCTLFSNVIVLRGEALAKVMNGFPYKEAPGSAFILFPCEDPVRRSHLRGRGPYLLVRSSWTCQPPELCIMNFCCL